MARVNTVKIDKHNFEAFFIKEHVEFYDDISYSLSISFNYLLSHKYKYYHKPRYRLNYTIYECGLELLQDGTMETTSINPILKRDSVSANIDYIHKYLKKYLYQHSQFDKDNIVILGADRDINLSWDSDPIIIYYINADNLSKFDIFVSYIVSDETYKQYLINKKFSLFYFVCGLFLASAFIVQFLLMFYAALTA